MTELQRPQRKSAGSHESGWRRLVERSLRGRQFEALVSRTDDGLTVGPIYRTPEQIAEVWARSPSVPWIVTQRIEDPDPERSRKDLAAEIAGSASGIELVFSGSASADRTGFGIEPKQRSAIAALPARDTHLTVDAGDASFSVYHSLSTIADADISLAFDPLAHSAARGGFDRPLVEIERNIVEAMREFEARGRAGAIAIADGRIWAAGGASEAQELSAILGSLTHLARLLIGAGVAPATALRRIAIVVDAGANQNLTIAKLRAVRLVHARLVEAFGLPPFKATVHAETSWRMMTRHDVQTNILRTTSAAFAAGIGGADSITVLPSTIALGLPDAFARRIARNSQTLLIEEAGLARVGDPSAGSGAIEALTTTLAEKAWEKFRAIEAVGGLLAVLRSGSFQRDLAEMRLARVERIARREIKITGVSAFPTLDESKVSVRVPRRSAAAFPAPASESITPLVSTRLAEPFEALRDRAGGLTGAGEKGGVFMAGIGNSSDLPEAAQAAANFFAAGGIRTREAGAFDTPEATAEAFVASGLCAACIVGAGGSMHAFVEATAAALRARGAVRIYFATDPDSYDDAAPFANVDATVADGINAIEVLSDLIRVLEQH